MPKITNKWLEAGTYQIGDKGKLHAASLSLKAPFYPSNKRVKGQYEIVDNRVLESNFQVVDKGTEIRATL